MTGISLHMIVKDEAELLPALLTHMRGWVDEIIIVDTGSRDATYSIAKAYTQKTYRYLFSAGDAPLDFSAVRNFAMGAVTKPWVFQVDADEWPTEELLRWTHVAVASPESKLYDGWSIMRQNLVGGEMIGPHTYERHVRLFRKGMRFVGRIHEKVNVQKSRTGLAPDAFLLQHHKTIERQERQNKLYRHWREQRMITGDEPCS
jgi:glycosyltransferase involved in cell wall biosynthesis